VIVGPLLAMKEISRSNPLIVEIIHFLRMSGVMEGLTKTIVTEQKLVSTNETC